MQSLMSFAVIYACLLHLSTVRASSDWGYDDGEADGPSNWATVNDDYEACGENSQSPIDFTTTTDDDNLGGFSFSNYDVTSGVTFTLENTGHSAKLSQSGTTMTLSGGSLSVDYIFAQLHFHWGSSDNTGSEHTVNGNRYPLELHLVHYSSDYDDIGDAQNQTSGLAVLGFLFEISDNDNTAFSDLITALTDITNSDDTTTVTTFAIMDLFDSSRGPYYRYSGSLTTPPCYESVVWTVFTETIPISSSQLAEFRDLMDDGSPAAALEDNYRPIQALNSRTVYYYPADDDDGAASITMSIGVITMATILNMLFQI